jgi:ABC-2 type transport system ATP-binding protein
VTAVLETHGLGKRYGRTRSWALSDCTLDIPAGHVVGLVGPNGAGKSTLLNLASGQIEPTAGTIEVVGGKPGSSPEQLAKVGFVAQGTPTYAGLSVADHLRLGAKLNPGWDAAVADERIARLGLDPARKAGELSGGQRSQLALTLGIAKRPELLILDEPVAALDPLARREFLQGLMEAAVDQELSVLISSHLVADLERLCDYLIVLVDARVRLVGEVDDLLARHHRLTGPRRDPLRIPSDQHVVTASHTDRQSTLVVGADGPILDPAWEVSQLSLEDLVLAYMSPGDTSPPRRTSSSNGGRPGHDDPLTATGAGDGRPELRVQR